MKKLFSIVVFLISTHLFCQTEGLVKAYPDPVYDTYFNKYSVKDDFRWLENLNGVKTQEWVKAQNKITEKYLAKASNKTKSLLSIEIYNQVKYRIPSKLRGRYFYYAYYNNQNNAALFYGNKFEDDSPVLLVDPSDISVSDNIEILSYSVSKNSKWLAYQYSRNGTDWAEAKIVNINTKFHKKDHLTGLKFSELAWKDDGFFYSVISQEGNLGQVLNEKIYYHRLGTAQSEDSLIFARPNKPARKFFYGLTHDERFLILEERDEQQNKFNVFYVDYNSPILQLRPLLTNLSTEFSIDFLDSHDNKLIAKTTLNCNTGKIVEIDPADPFNWRTIVESSEEAVLTYVKPFKEKILALYQKNQKEILIIADYAGKILYSLELDAGTTINRVRGEYDDNEIYLAYESYTFPPVVYKFNLKTYEREVTHRTDVTFSADKFEYKQKEYSSKDGTMVPITIVHKKGLSYDGTNPTLLETYGGFGTISEPVFDPGIVHFIKEGGVYAFAGIRGGGEKGKTWGWDGRGMKKQNSIDDLIAAAEYLIKNKYTTDSKLAIKGESNGGMVVAAAAIQRPELFDIVIPVSAPLDMLRFENFTVGHWHIEEYGTVKNEDNFVNLQNYSPYHNIKPEVNYPTMLVVASSNDDRVPPFHSYKFVAELQQRNSQYNPVFLRVIENEGHSGHGDRYSNIKQGADIIGFILYNLRD